MNLKKNIKRRLAGAMAFVMLLGGVPGTPAGPLGGMTAEASELYPDNTMKANSGGQMSAYRWGSSRGFDIAGIKDSNLLNAEEKYTGSASSNVKTTYSWAGYQTRIGPAYATTPHSTNKYGSNGYNNNTGSGSGPVFQYSVKPATNGGVQTFDTLGVEVQMKVYPSADEKWILVDYIIKNLTGNNNSIMIGSGADVMIGDVGGGGDGPSDAAALYLDDRGFRMVCENTPSMAGSYEVFELITQGNTVPGNELGVTTVTSRWGGNYYYYESNMFTDLPSFSDANLDASSHGQRKINGQLQVKGVGTTLDSGLAYSWKVDLSPYATQTRRVAFGAKGPSFYVSDDHGHSSATTTGSYDDPFKTIEDAIARIKHLGVNMGYVLIQDYKPLTATIEVDRNIMFQTADYDKNYNPIATPVTLVRDGGFSGPMFTTENDNAAVRLSDIILDGQNASVDSAFVEADKGEVNLLSGTELVNNNLTGTAKGSAINVTGTANLSMNDVEITGNKSGAKGAVYFAGGDFKVRGAIQIKDNFLSDGTTPANAYLAEGKYMVIDKDSDGLETTDADSPNNPRLAEIHVTTENIPDPSDINETPAPNEKKALVVHESGSRFDTVAYQNYIKADRAAADGVIVTTDGNDIVLRKSGVEVIRVYVDEDDNVLSQEETAYIEPGSAVNLPPKDPSGFTGIAGVDGSHYQFAGTTVIGPGLSVVDGTGNVTGTMPSTTVTITNIYKKKESRIIFQANGGNPEPATIVGKAGDPVYAILPPGSSMSRPGYVFEGWREDPGLTIPVTALPTHFDVGDVTYYAEWSGGGSFAWNIRYVNEDEGIEFANSSNPYAAEALVSAGQRVVPGYVIENRYVLPQLEDELIDSVTGAISGKMKANDSTATYQYKVDHAQTFNITVRYEMDPGGVTIHPNYTSTASAEDPLTLAPETIFGYTYDSAQFVRGESKDPANLLTGITDTYGDDFAADGTLITRMPNQDVELVYKYTASGSGFAFVAKYMDTADNEAIADPIVDRAPYQAPIVHTYQPVYGYLFDNNTEKNPATAIGSFDAAGNYSGDMPNGPLTITLGHSKDPSKWDNITYVAGQNGTLNNTGRPKVNDAGNGEYKAYVLINDGTTEGIDAAFDWASINDKKLTANPVADRYYLFDQWFIDTNGDGKLDPGEEIITDDRKFTGPVTLTANFVENPDEWIDIHFAAGVNGSISSPATCHIPYDKTWTDIPVVPTATPVVNYLIDGWYDNGQRVQGTTPLTDGQTYIHQFKKDPVIWGLPVNTPDADGRLDMHGGGEIIVHDTSPDYQYVIVDEDGNVVAVQNGDNSGSLTFPDLYPGHEYQVYEVGLGETVNPGDPVSGIGDKSAPQNVLIPVLEDNYRITPDPHEDGKVTIIVNPADQDSKYAIIDKDGNVVHVPDSDGDGWVDPKGNNPSVVEFPGLNPNEEYTVVAVPKDSTGVTPSEREDKGSTVIADPGVELNIPTYTVETIRGSIVQAGDTAVNGQSCETVKEGDLVSLTAAADNAGNAFAYWQVLIGNIDGISGKILEREVDFVMPKTNVVLAAYYERPVSTPSNALVEDEVRGGSAGEMAVNPEYTQTLEQDLTTDHDRDLMEENGAEVVYKIVFDKNKIKSGEKDAIISGPDYYTGVEKELAFTSPWALNIRLERYVDGRKVNIATSSNATSAFEVVVQLEDEHIDMLDYQLFEISEDAFGNIITEAVGLDGPSENRQPNDPAGENKPGGLFRFEGKIGARYVMVYSKAFWVKFINEHKGCEFPPDPLLNVSTGHKYKVRRRYPINGADYLTDFDKIWSNPLDSYRDVDGIQHTYEGWSTKKLPEAYKAYNPDAGVGKPLVLYAYYKNNIKEITDERSALDDYIEELLKLADEHFLTAEEKQEILDEVREAKELQEKTGPRASLDELRSKTQELKAVVEHYEPILVERKEEYDQQHTGGGNSASGGGGSGSGGGSGKGTSAKPYIPASAQTYTVGVNGSWQKIDKDGKRWAFVLNGGTPIRGMWAWLDYREGDAVLTGWYHFNASGEMDSGWFRDERSNWYYCDTVHDGTFGKMKTGWHYDQDDKRWYYLDGESGMMATGWREIGGKWYYFAPTAAQETYEQDPVTRKWSFKQVSTRPLGSMYADEATPDGYQVGADGAWIR